MFVSQEIAEMAKEELGAVSGAGMIAHFERVARSRKMEK